MDNGKMTRRAAIGSIPLGVLAAASLTGCGEAQAGGSESSKPEIVNRLWRRIDNQSGEDSDYTLETEYDGSDRKSLGLFTHLCFAEDGTVIALEIADYEKHPIYGVVFGQWSLMDDYVLVRGFTFKNGDRYYSNGCFSGIFSVRAYANGTMALLDAAHDGYGMDFKECSFAY